MSETRVLVIGAGIAGLSFARAARYRDLAVEVIERAVGWDPVGAGMYLPANAVRALQQLGLGPTAAGPPSQPSSAAVGKTHLQVELCAVGGSALGATDVVSGRVDCSALSSLRGRHCRRGRKRLLVPYPPRRTAIAATDRRACRYARSRSRRTGTSPSGH